MERIVKKVIVVYEENGQEIREESERFVLTTFRDIKVEGREGLDMRQIVHKATDRDLVSMLIALDKSVTKIMRDHYGDELAADLVRAAKRGVAAAMEK